MCSATFNDVRRALRMQGLVLEAGQMPAVLVPHSLL